MLLFTGLFNNEGMRAIRYELSMRDMMITIHVSIILNNSRAVRTAIHIALNKEIKFALAFIRK